MRWCKTCRRCEQKKPRPGPKKHSLGQEPPGAPFERIAMDILEPGTITEAGNRYILVISDYFTKWVEAYALPNHTAQTVADITMTQFITRFGVPGKIHTDQGPEFESKLMKELCHLLRCEKTHTTPYHPQSDGLVERANRTLLDMLTALVNPQADDWDEWLPYVLAAYRSSVQESTGCTPNLMTFGRENILPMDLMYPCKREESPACSHEYVQWIREVMQAAHNFARQHMKQAMARQKKNYDRSTLDREFPIGTWVWYGILLSDGKRWDWDGQAHTW